MTDRATNFNKPILSGHEFYYMRQAVERGKISGDGYFTARCQEWFEKNFNIKKTLLTTSCTHALEMTAILANIQPGDEVIAPAFTFTSTVNAFVLRGAHIKFVDIRPDTMNIDEKQIEDAITKRTKIIVVMHYAGVACEMDTIIEIAARHNLIIVEDAAQAVMSSYKAQPLGSLGDFGVFSFHETKNYSMGEGGALLLNRLRYIERAEIIREKGTNRNQFFRGEIDKYSWCDIGSSYLPSDMNAAFLWAQLEVAYAINENRLQSWNAYYDGLMPLAKQSYIELPIIPKDCVHNGHIFYIKCKDLLVRTQLIEYLKTKQIAAVSHYVPLHQTKAGIRFSTFVGEDKYTIQESERLLRLPLYYQLSLSALQRVIEEIHQFFTSAHKHRVLHALGSQTSAEELAISK